MEGIGLVVLGIDILVDVIRLIPVLQPQHILALGFLFLTKTRASVYRSSIGR